ncbi:unnamed protein product [Rotaria sordida]|uniref:Cadherin domain-containing protein n=1 Tax=Rotaria sordida TaxID=392033 RepID=A0A815EQX0_9BILA|nr:unnamed protein product [Rotaria sordida]
MRLCLVFWLYLIVNISIIESQYIRLSTVNCSELSPIGTSIIQLLDILPLSNWEFTFLTQTLIESYFLLDNLKGTIIIKNFLDRENLCRLNLCSCLNQCLIKLDIHAISDKYTYILSLPILIYDENDNYCYFLNDIYYLNISENIQLNTHIILPIGYDPDLTPNNIQYYYLLENNYTEFYFNNQLPPSIIIIKQLDRELNDKYYFNYCAYEEQHSCCMKIILTIIDINDNSAIFQYDQQLPLIINVSEFTSINTELIQMKAFDIDDGLNGQIIYTFSKWTLNDKTINEIFNLNSQNGSIILLKQLDYEQRNNYELQIQAIDLGLNAIPTYATVIIQVIDENDCIPEMFIFTPTDVRLINNSSIYIMENISINTAILYLTVSDCDTGDNGYVTIELISLNSIVKLEKVTNSTYILITNINFDREQNSSYSFSLNIYDHGKPINSLINTFNLYLIDINDCFPYFDNSINYSFIIDENNQENFIIHTFEIFDNDENDQIILYIKFINEEEKDIFQINKQNQLIIKKSLDYEYKSFYNLTIIAQDLIEHQTSILINIYLNDLNDNPVKFHRNFLQIQIQENHLTRTFLSQIQAEDKDKNNQIIYYIHPNDLNYIENLIELTTNGNLYTKIKFNQKQINKFQFRIIANDSLYTDIILIEILINNNILLKPQSPYCFTLNNNNNNENIQIEFQAYRNVSFYLKNPSSSDLILFPNGTLIVKSILNKYSFDIYLQENNYSAIFINFILLIQFKCENYHFIQFYQEIIFISLIIFIIFIIIIIYFYFQHKIQKKLFKKKINITRSFSLSLNDILFLSCPSSQMTPMTIISSSTHQQTDNSSTLSTYIKLSHSLKDETF